MKQTMKVTEFLDAGGGYLFTHIWISALKLLLNRGN